MTRVLGQSQSMPDFERWKSGEVGHDEALPGDLELAHLFGQRVNVATKQFLTGRAE
jgi:hypothetical protein